MYGYVYVTTNKINNRMYVGQHKYNKPEIDPKYLGSGILLEKAIDKYGEENFTCKLLTTADSKKELNQKEIEYIKSYKDRYGELCYNLASGGRGGDCYPMTPERRKAIGDALRGRKRSPEIIKKVAACMVGRVVSEESRIKSRLSNLGQKRSPECCQHMKDAHKDKIWMNNGKCNKFVHKDNISAYINDGFVFGKLGYRQDGTIIEKSSTTREIAKS